MFKSGFITAVQLTIFRVSCSYLSQLLALVCVDGGMRNGRWWHFKTQFRRKRKLKESNFAWEKSEISIEFELNVLMIKIL